MKTTYNLKFTGEDVLSINEDRQQESVAYQGGSGVDACSTNGLHSWPLTRNSTAIAAAFAAYVPLASVGAEPDPVGKAAATTAEASVQFDIPAQGLPRALSAFTAQSHIQVLYEGDIATGLRNAPLKGAYTPEKALRALLTATRLQARFTDARTVTLERKVISIQSGSNAGDTIALGKVTVNAAAEVDPSDPYSKAYTVPHASTATKTDTPIMETPVSIQVVPRAVMDDQQVIRLEDAAKNVSGVQRDFTFGSAGYEGFTIRGFSTNSNFYRNGIRLITQSSETAHLNQVEVLKGPAAMLFGRVQPGGLVNAVTKRPLDQAYYSLQQQFGSYDFYRTTVDATGPITGDRSLLYRFNLAYLSTNSFRDVVFDDRIFLAPSLTWRLSDATEINLNFEYKDEDYVDDTGIPAIGKRPAPIPLRRFLGEPQEHARVETQLVDFNWSHKFNDHWKIQNGFVWNSMDYQFREHYSSFLEADNRTLVRSPWFVDNDRESHTVYANLTGDFETFGVHHDVLLGADYFYAQNDRARGIDSLPSSTIDIFNPVYGQVDFDGLKAMRKNAPNFFFTADEEWYGIYFQDQIKLWADKLHILGGGRYDWAKSATGFSESSFAAINESKTDDEHFSPRVGLLYQPWSWLSLYGNYTESLGSNNRGRSRTGQAFDPEIATQYEAGVKAEFFDGRLMSSVAYYHLTKENLLTPDPVSPQFSVAVGEARSQGIEVDIKGQVSEAISLIGTYAYTDARITKSNGNDLGNRLLNVPEHSGSFWAKYDFVNTPLQGLSFGAGAYLASQREGDNANSFQLPGYVRVDAMAAYSWNVMGTRMTAQVNVNNLLDKSYFASSKTRGWILPADPLTVIGSVRLEY